MTARALALTVAILLLGVLGIAEVAHAEVGEIEVRVAAQRLDDGRTEFAIQERQAGGEWGERRLPRARFFPADASADRWLASSPLVVSLPGSEEIDVRVATQLLADGRMEFAIQERQADGEWGERRLPRARFFPADAAIGRWLASSPLEVSDLTPDMPAAAAVVPFSISEFTNGRWLEQQHPQLAATIKRLAWVQDGVSEMETETIQDLLFVAVTSHTVASSILSFTWVQDGMEEVEADAINWLNNIGSAEVTSAAVSLGWVEDGIEPIEAGVIQQISYIDYDSSTIALSVVSLAWVRDGVEEVEADAIYWLRNIGSEEVASSVASLGWVEDGIKEAEVIAIEYLSYISNEDSATAEKLVSLKWVGDGITGREVQLIKEVSYLSNGHPEQAMKIVGMQFLESIGAPDLSAVEALSDLSAFRSDDFEIVMSHPSIQDGITDDEAKIVATLYGVSQYVPELVNTLLDPDKVSLEERAIELPLAGEVLLAIIRTDPGAERSMDLLEHAVRHAEEFMATPFPTGYVGWLVGDAVTPTFAGNNFGTNITTLPKYDRDDDIETAETASVLVAHEVAHYYWIGNSVWVDEGVANLVASVSENARTGQPVEVTTLPCGYVRTIAELESLDTSSDDGADSAFGCNYSLGERLFMDLYRRLSEEAFRLGLRDLYLTSLAKAENEAQVRAGVGIDEVRAAFGGDEDGGVSTVDAVAARWYDGTEPYDTAALSAGQSNPLLRTIDGRIHLAYLAGSYEGTPVSTISAGAIGDGLWLLLRWTYTVGSAKEVPLEIVHYYEDGFEFRRRSVSFTADARHNDSLWSWWLPVGRSSDVRWAPGRYRLHVYNEGRRLVELEYVVTR